MKQILIYTLAIFLSFTAMGQAALEDELFGLIKARDSLLFELGFNTCNIEVLQDLISDDFSFYHDQTGITNSKEGFINSIQNGLCKLPYRANRVLNDSSLTIYPLKNNGVIYGAIENGEHSFYAIEEHRTKYLTSVAQFTHLWLLENGEWKLSSALSFDHKAIERNSSEPGLFRDEAITNNWLKQKKIPNLAIGYIENNRITQCSVFGELDKASTASLNTIWNVASLTKPITAMVTLSLVNKGLWTLDESLDKHFIDPDLTNDPRTKLLTSRLILSHQSGLPNWRGDNADGKLNFAFEPGTQQQYSGEGFEYLRKALEAKFDITLEQLAQELIFDPLKMNHTQFVWDDEITNGPVAAWYSSEGTRYETDKFYQANAADNLLTTIGDYTKFLLYVMEGAGLSEALQREMISEQVRINDRKHWGLCWWIDEEINENGDIAIVHGGDDIGVHCIAFLLPNSGKALVIFTNSDNGTDAYLEIINYYLGKDADGIFQAEMTR